MSICFYEAVLALNPQTSESSQKELFTQIQKVIKDFSGSLHHIDELGSRPLANIGKIKGIKRAIYFHFSYKALGSAVKEVERIFKINDSVLYSHQEKMDARISLDQHQSAFEQILKNSQEREEARQAYIQMKRKKHAPTDTTLS